MVWSTLGWRTAKEQNRELISYFLNADSADRPIH